MIYAMGSNLFKAVVVLAAGAQAGPGCCGGHAHSHGHDEVAHGDAAQDLKAHDLADEGDMEKQLDEMDDSDISTQAPEDMDNMSSEQAGEQPPPPADVVTEEQFLEAKTALGLEDEDMTRVLELVEKVPAEFKDPDFKDQELAQAFCYHYHNGEAQKDAEGVEKAKNKANMIEELRQLVEEEIPVMQQQMQQEQQQQQGGMGGMGGMGDFDEDMMAQLQKQMAEMGGMGGLGEEEAQNNEDSADEEPKAAEEATEL